MIKKSNILGIFFVVFLGVLVPWQMIRTVFKEITPEGRYENYKEYISESAKIWLKNRDNQFYDKENILNWYETPDKKGKKPMDLFPPIIYSNIKDAIKITFIDSSYIIEPDSIKKVIAEYMDSKKETIIKHLDKE